MLSLISPAKALDYESRLPTKKRTSPRMQNETSALVDVMAAKSIGEIQDLMSLSDDLAALNFERYQLFGSHEPARPALLAFNGDVYQAMDRASFGERDFTAAQKQLRILSGLYGLLRPMDEIHPHRLEMGTKLATERGDSLYDFWGSRITDMLKQDLEDQNSSVLVNLASAEYSSSVNLDELGVTVITPTFKDMSPAGQYRVVSFFAKRARGMMSGWLIRNRIKSRRALKEFSEGGYAYSAADSTPTAPVFLRDKT